MPSVLLPSSLLIDRVHGTDRQIRLRMQHNYHPAQPPVHKLVVRATHRHRFESILPKPANNITAVAKHVSLSIRDLLAILCREVAQDTGEAHTLSTKLSTTRFSPARSNAMVSLLPSTTVTLPLPNFWWNTRSPTEKSDTAPVDFATSSPSMVDRKSTRLNSSHGYTSY